MCEFTAKGAKNAKRGGSFFRKNNELMRTGTNSAAQCKPTAPGVYESVGGIYFIPIFVLTLQTSNSHYSSSELNFERSHPPQMLPLSSLMDLTGFLK